MDEALRHPAADASAGRALDVSHRLLDILGRADRARRGPAASETFLRERIFEPLGMKDTGFIVPPAKLDRLATAMRPTPRPASSRSTTVSTTAAGPSRRLSPIGGGGLVSTVDDYLAFGRMMLDKGRHGSERILSRASVELMTTDQLTPAAEGARLLRRILGQRGWGFGVSDCHRARCLASRPAAYGWDGGYRHVLAYRSDRGAWSAS